MPRSRSSLPRILTPARPPATRIDPVVETFLSASAAAGTAGIEGPQSIEVVDRYRWLEGDNSNPTEMGTVTPEVASWTDEQNAYTREVLEGLPGRKSLEDRLRPLMEVGVVSAPSVRANRYFYAKREGTQNQPIIYWREGYCGDDRVLIDPARLDATGLTTVTWTSPSNDGRTMAYGTYRSGDENTTLHLLDVDTGHVGTLEIPNKTSAPQWLPDDSGFVYQNLKDPGDPYSGQVLYHRLGAEPALDLVLFRQFTRDEDAALATTWGPTGSLSPDGCWLLLGYWVDTQSNDLWLVDFRRFLASGASERVPVSIGTPGHAYGEVVAGTMYLHTTKGAPRGRIVAAPVATPGESAWQDVVPERDDAVIESMSLAAGHIVVTYLRNASNRVEVFELTGRSIGVFNQPGIGSTGIATEPDRLEAFLTFTSFNYPATIFRVDVTRPSAAAELWQQPTVPVDPATVDVEQVWYASKDSTPVSMFLVHRKGLMLDGRNPTLLYGYGGFNVSLTPSFSAVRFQWFEEGGVLAIPNLRGGGEYGDAWHAAGTLDRKQNVFDDFIAAAEWLIGNAYTSPDRLAVSGGSNGGLLTGAVVTQRPDLCRAAVVSVPLLDMLRYQHFLMARYWVPEYGTAEEPGQFDVLAAYSPYHHVSEGVRYPAVFLTAGEYDTRVHALHARKMAARLQAATASDPAGAPVLLWVDREAGHGQGKPLNLQLRDVVDQRIFLMWQLGMLDGFRS
jgi:prolyl oligopeptidase